MKELLVEVNIVSKNFQNHNTQLDVLIDLSKGLIAFLEKYIENEFYAAMETARKLTIYIGIESKFKEVRFRKNKISFSYGHLMSF